MKNLQLAFSLVAVLWSFTLLAQDATAPVTSGEKVLRQEGGMIFAQYYMGDQRVDKLTFINQLRTHPAAHTQYQSGQNISIVGGTLATVSALGFGIVYFSHLGESFSIGQDKEKIERRNRVYLMTGIGAGIGLVAYLAGRGKMKKGLTLHNTSAVTQLDLGVSENGIGIVLSF